MASPKEIFEFLDYCRDYSNAGLLLDIGHLNVAAYYLGFDKVAFLKKLVSKFRDKIFEIHVSSNSGEKDTHSISTPDSFEIRFIQDHADIFADIPLVLEWHQNLSASVYKEYLGIAENLQIELRNNVNA
ncbi:MAG: DUF692 family protein [Desulfobacterales bacterium]|nr:DUF692 family protein [Desulfobacterales bacterium]